MFTTVFKFYCFVGLSKGFFPTLQHCKIFLAVVQVEKASFFRTTAEKKSETALHTFAVVAILLANRKKLLKFYRFESVQDLLFFSLV